MQSPASRYVFPALGTLYERCRQYAWPIFRVSYGAFYIPHGCQKLFGWFGGKIRWPAKGRGGPRAEPVGFWVYYTWGPSLVCGRLSCCWIITPPVAPLV